MVCCFRTCTVFFAACFCRFVVCYDKHLRTSRLRRLIDLDEHSNDLEQAPLQKSNHLCALSKTMNTTNDGYFGYPMEIFAPEQYLRVVATVYGPASNEFLRCRSANAWHQESNCSTHTQCPISDAILNAARARVTWPYRHNFCALNRALQTPGESVRVINFGGSVSMGQLSIGCECWKSEFNPSCKEPPSQHELRERNCPWSRYFSHWLGKTSRANVKLHNLAYHGFDTWSSTEQFWLLLRDAGIKGFTENDIIFLDHSVNDGFGGCNHCGTHITALVHRILSISADYSWPTIVLLLQDTNEMKSNKFEQPNSYNDTAEKLQLPMWSIRDTLPALPENIRYYVNTSGYHGWHVGWWDHLYFADVYASLFQYEMNQCELGHGHVPFERPRATMNSSFVPQLEKGGEDQCDSSFQAIEISSAHRNSFANISIQMTGAWRYEADKPGRFGWIAHFPPGNDTPTTGEEGEPSKLSYLLELGGGAEFDKHVWILKVFYLRTYENAGTAKITMCNKDLFFAHIDALWDKKASLPMMEYFVVAGQSLLYNHPPGCNPSVVTVEITHQRLLPDVVSKNLERKQQKVKILGISLCKLLQ